MKLARKVGATSEIWQVFIRDSSSTTGAGLTGLTNASGGLTAYFHRDTDTTATAISLVSMTVGTFTSSGFKEIDATNMPGWYQFCPPNTALATGAKSCAVHLKGAADMAPLPIEVDLDAQVDVTHIGGTVQTARDIGASVLLSSGTGTGQVKIASGYLAMTWADIAAPTTIVALSGTTVKTATDVETDTADIQTRLPAALQGGFMKSDIRTSLGVAVTNSDLTIAAVTNDTDVTLPALDSAGNTVIDSAHANTLWRIVAGTGIGQLIFLGARTGTRKYAFVDAFTPTNPSTDSELILIGTIPLLSTIPTRTLDVTATGAAGVDWANVENPTTTVGLSGTTIKTASDVEADTADIQTRLPAALTVDGNMKSDALAVSGDVTAADNLESYLDGTEFMPVDGNKQNVAISGDTLTAKKPDTSTTAYTKTLTRDSGAEPIISSIKD